MPGRSNDPGPLAPTATPVSDEADSTWTPLLTHPDDSQPFRAVLDEPQPDYAEPFARNQAAPAGGPGQVEQRGRVNRPGQAGPPGDFEPNGRGSPAPAEPPVTTRRHRGTEPNPMEAAALAGAFAADYLSWDEGDPARRGHVLARYLPTGAVGSPALLGWSGTGRQRAEFALPGAVHQDGDGRVMVDVRVRVTPYRAVGQPAEPAHAGELEVVGVPAVAPAPTARGWKSLDSHWVRMSVPVSEDQGRLVVDIWDERGAPARPTGPGGHETEAG